MKKCVLMYICAKEGKENKYFFSLVTFIVSSEIKRFCL